MAPYNSHRLRLTTSRSRVISETARSRDFSRPSRKPCSYSSEWSDKVGSLIRCRSGPCWLPGEVRGGSGGSGRNSGVGHPTVGAIEVDGEGLGVVEGDRRPVVRPDSPCHHRPLVILVLGVCYMEANSFSSSTGLALTLDIRPRPSLVMSKRYDVSLCSSVTVGLMTISLSIAII